MLRSFRNGKDMDWSDQREFEYRCQTTPKLNIGDLVKHVLHKINTKPPEIESFGDWEMYQSFS